MKTLRNTTKQDEIHVNTNAIRSHPRAYITLHIEYCMCTLALLFVWICATRLRGKGTTMSVFLHYHLIYMYNILSIPYSASTVQYHITYYTSISLQCQDCYQEPHSEATTDLSNTSNPTASDGEVTTIICYAYAKFCRFQGKYFWKEILDLGQAVHEIFLNKILISYCIVCYISRMLRVTCMYYNACNILWRCKTSLLHEASSDCWRCLYAWGGR